MLQKWQCVSCLQMSSFIFILVWLWMPIFSFLFTISPFVCLSVRHSFDTIASLCVITNLQHFVLDFVYDQGNTKCFYSFTPLGWKAKWDDCLWVTNQEHVFSPPLSPYIRFLRMTPSKFEGRRLFYDNDKSKFLLYWTITKLFDNNWN